MTTLNMIELMIFVLSLYVGFHILKELLIDKYKTNKKLRLYDNIENGFIKCFNENFNINISDIQYEDSNDERLRTLHNENLIMMIWKGYSDIWCVRMSYIDNDIIHLEYNDYKQMLDVVSDMNTYKKWFPDYIRDKKINEILND